MLPMNDICASCGSSSFFFFRLGGRLFLLDRHRERASRGDSAQRTLSTSAADFASA